MLQGCPFRYKMNLMDALDFTRPHCSPVNGFKRFNLLSLPSTSSRWNCCNVEFPSGRKTPFGQASRFLSLKACQVTSEDSEGTFNGDGSVLDEQTLVRELQIAVEKENYAQAAKIRDSLRDLQEDSKACILAANARFYDAFRNGDLATMQNLWAEGDNVCCVHPGASGVLGYRDVMESWEIVWMDYDFPLEIDLKNVRVHFKGDVGYVTCVEFVRTKGSSWGAQFVTNVFERNDGQWFICVHHASPVEL